MSNVISSFLVNVVYRTGTRNAGSQCVVFHALAHTGHMFLPVLHLVGKGCVQELSVAGILIAAVWFCVCHGVDHGSWYVVISLDVEHDSVARSGKQVDLVFHVMRDYPGFTSIEKYCDTCCDEQMNLAFN